MATVARSTSIPVPTIPKQGIPTPYGLAPQAAVLFALDLAAAILRARRGAR